MTPEEKNMFDIPAQQTDTPNPSNRDWESLEDRHKDQVLAHFGKVYKLNIERAGIPSRYQEAHLTNNCDWYKDLDGKDTAYSIAMDFAKTGFLPDRGQNRHALFICGDYGRGKTWLATAVFKHMVYNCLAIGIDITFSNPAKWSKFYSITRAVQACYGSDAEITSDMVISSFQISPLLLIDDIGDLDAKGETEDRRRILYEIIDYRNDYYLPTILTSNLNVDQMADRFGERMFQRLYELCVFVEMAGENLREVR